MLASKGAAGHAGICILPTPPAARVPVVDNAPHLTHAHQTSETHRIIRAAHAFGVLRLPLVPRRFLPGRVERQYENIRDRVLGEVAPEVSRRDAIAKLRSARDLLVDGDLQVREGSRLLADRNLTAPHPGFTQQA